MADIKPWWERFQITVKWGEGRTFKTRCGATSITRIPGGICFMLTQSPGAAELALTKPADVEVQFDGAWYRVFGYPEFVDSLTPLHLDCEPIPGRTDAGVTCSTAKPPIQEQVLEALRSAPNGLTARQIGDALECSQRWTFAALATLQRDGKIEKHGALYRMSLRTDAPCAR